MRLSIEIPIGGWVLVIFIVLFTLYGMVAHIVFLPLLQLHPLAYYPVLSVFFLASLYSTQWVYLRYYYLHIRRRIKSVVREGKRPSEFMSEAMQTRRESDNQGMSQRELEALVKEMEKRAGLR